MMRKCFIGRVTSSCFDYSCTNRVAVSRQKRGVLCFQCKMDRVPMKLVAV